MSEWLCLCLFVSFLYSLLWFHFFVSYFLIYFSLSLCVSYLFLFLWFLIYLCPCFSLFIVYFLLGFLSFFISWIHSLYFTVLKWEGQSFRKMFRVWFPVMAFVLARKVSTIECRQDQSYLFRKGDNTNEGQDPEKLSWVRLPINMFPIARKLNTIEGRRQEEFVWNWGEKIGWRKWWTIYRKKESDKK